MRTQLLYLLIALLGAACTASQPFADDAGSSPAATPGAAASHASDSSAAATGSQPQSIAEKTDGMERYDGFLPFYWDEETGKVWMEIERFDRDILYINSLATGIGSNDIGLDRGQIGQDRLIRFKRVGPRVLMVQPNQDFRAETDNRPERQSVEEAFAESVLWGFEVAAEEDGRVLVEVTGFLKRDAHGVADRLRGMNEGAYQVDPSRSALYLPRTDNFPENTEFEATLTFTGDNPGPHLRSVTPSPEAVTVRQHHSFVKLPEEPYERRSFHPRSGFYPQSFQDYSAQPDEPLTERFIPRHRLEKTHPEQESSGVEEPIVFYLDPGTPEPVRTALLDGARWWAEAFEEAGFEDAFRVEMLPEHADPMDVRYNVIQWVHRSTRGWSYGRSVVDPRSGEILKGHVSLGSLRIRQDYQIFEGLLSPYEAGRPIEELEGEMLETALNRIRQLSAHEIGHTIGIAHNFAASISDRASVMDYPHPKVHIEEDGSLDLSDAYDTGIGDWDKRAVLYGYQDFPDGVDEEQELRRIIRETDEMGLRFISDSDARPQGGSHPYAHLWDNGEDAVRQLDHIMQVRRHALDRFSEAAIQQDRPLSELQQTLVPIYLYHRYQVEAAVKIIGGTDYDYTLREDDHLRTFQTVEARWQRQAINELMATMTPEELALNDRVIDAIPPAAYGHPETREYFDGNTGPNLDLLAAAESAADHTVRLMLNPQRAARLVQQHSRNSDYPGLSEMISTMIDRTWKNHDDTGYHGEIERVVEHVILYRLMQLAANDRTGNQVRAMARMHLHELAEWLEEHLPQSVDEAQQAHRHLALQKIRKFEQDPDTVPLPQPADTPPGSPIGSCGLH